MARPSTQARREIERRFPVRVRIAVPPEGLGRQLEVICAWLDETCGAEGWAMAPAGTAGIINNALALYFEHSAVAHAFITRFCCGHRVEMIEGALAVQRDGLPARRTATFHKTPG